MKLNEYILGYADADTEFINNEEIFLNAFYDTNNYLDELMNKYKFMIVGRKGAGKTAYASKIRSISNSCSGNSEVVYIHLNELEFHVFKKIADKKYSGTQKYQKIWEWIIGFEIIKHIVDNKFELKKDMQTIIDILKQNEIFLTESLPVSIKKVSKKHATFSAKLVEVGGEFESNSISLDIYDFVDKIYSAISNVYFNRKFFVIFDGLDDLIRFNSDSIELLSGLIRAAHYKNLYFMKERINVKNLVLIRTDILMLINDPDINKIKRDGAINISWNMMDLKQMVNLRLKMVNYSSADPWYDIFPSKIKNMDSWDYVISHTLLRPRDVFQFLKQAQDLFPEKEKLSHSQCNDVLKEYSSSYFMEEMKDELSGFIDDTTLHQLYDIFHNIGQRDFTFGEFTDSVVAILGQKDSVFCADLLEKLVSISFVGQIITTHNYDKELKKNVSANNIQFKYKYPRMLFSKNNKFHIHRALYRALDFSIK